jgi:hypothetical protein
VGIHGAAESAHLREAHDHAPAAEKYGYEWPYRSRPNWETYASLLELAALVKRDLGDLEPRDMIDVQSFLWVQGSDEYA